MSNSNQNETSHDLNDNISVAGSKNDEMFEDAPLGFDPTYLPLENGQEII